VLALPVHAHHPSTSRTNTPDSNSNKQPESNCQWTEAHLLAQKTTTRAKDCARYVPRVRVRARPRGMRFGTRTSASYWMDSQMRGLGMVASLLVRMVISLSFWPLWQAGAVLRLLKRADDA